MGIVVIPVVHTYIAAAGEHQARCKAYAVQCRRIVAGIVVIVGIVETYQQVVGNIVAILVCSVSAIVIVAVSGSSYSTGSTTVADH